jgi:hypothetical protein
VGVERASVGETQELVLAATLDAGDESAGQRPQARRGDVLAECAVHHARAYDGPAFCGRAQDANCSLDFW